MKLAFIVFFLIALGLGVSSFAAAPDDRVTQSNGLILIKPAPTDPKLNNPWPAEWEQAIQQRFSEAIAAYRGKGAKGSTSGENEKDMYAKAMFAMLTGDPKDYVAGLKCLQTEDADAKRDHVGTAGIDYYWSFTIKHQMRKYFYFGADLEPAYKQRMFDGARAWTAEDPLRRPHPVYGKGDPKKGVWGPDHMGSWIDVRGTDNLRAMRDTSVYLMAEETGNEKTRLLAKSRILEFVRTLYNIGQPEWDSTNYHSHGLAPYHNLYDFAKDPETKALAKAALDWLYATAAFKYWRGGMGGPGLREYGSGYVVFGGNANHALALYFGDTPVADPEPERDEFYHITSAYRPPAAVVELARKNFARPVELFASHPYYDLWKPEAPGANAKARFHETQFIGRTFMLGTGASADPEIAWNPCMFKLMAYNSKRGVDFFCANLVSLIGHSFKYPGDQIGQYRNLAIWLRPIALVTAGDGGGDPKTSESRRIQPFMFMAPKTAALDIEDGVWFLRYEKTWLAVRPIRLRALQRHEIAKSKNDGKVDKYADDNFHVAEMNGETGKDFAGFALEVGEEGGPHSDYAAFKAAVKKSGKLQLSADGKTATLVASTGETLGLTHNDKSELPTVIRNGKPHDWAAHQDSWGPAEGARVSGAPISQARRSGKLRVEAGGRLFEAELTNDGKYTFRNDSHGQTTQ